MSIYPKDIDEKMIELAKLLNYDYKKIKHLRDAMDRDKVQTLYNSDNYFNSNMAVLGDRVLSLILTERMYKEGKSKGDISIERADEEKNSSLEKFKDQIDIKQYAFKEDFYAFDNETHRNNKVSIGGHEEFVEAIIAAIYLDRGIRYVTNWINTEYLKRIKE